MLQQELNSHSKNDVHILSQTPCPNTPKPRALKPQQNIHCLTRKPPIHDSFLKPRFYRAMRAELRPGSPHALSLPADSIDMLNALEKMPSVAFEDPPPAAVRLNDGRSRYTHIRRTRGRKIEFARSKSQYQAQILHHVAKNDFKSRLQSARLRFMWQLDLDAPGDFMLMHRGAWHRLRGAATEDGHNVHHDTRIACAAAASGLIQVRH